MTASSAAATGAQASRERHLLPIVEVATIVALAAFPVLITLAMATEDALDFNNYVVIRVTSILLLAMLAISFDLSWGYSGIMSFGHALFFGVGAYLSAKLAGDAGITEFFVIVPAGMAAGMLSALLLGWFLLIGKRTPTIIFLALGTLTASFAAQRLAAGLEWLGAANGLSIWSFLTVAGLEIEPGIAFYYLALALLLVAYLASRYLVRSQFGLALAGIRQNENRLAFLGYRLQTCKLIVFAFSGLIAGAAGSIYAFDTGFVGPSTIGITTSTFAVLYGLFGGVGTLIGPVIGTVVIEGLTVVLSDNDALKAYWPIALGVIMLVVVSYRPAGLVSLLVGERERFGSFGIVRGRERRTSTHG
jgi:branched-chain amino acid transport system permease protein